MTNQLIEQAADGILTINLRGSILYANKAAARIVRRPFKKIIGKHFMGFLEKESRAKAKSYINQVVRRKIAVRDELHALDSKGKLVPIEFSASPIFEKTKIHQINIIIRDITDRKKVEYLEREAEKMKALQNFLSGTAGEIQYPLKGLLTKTDELIESIKHRDFEYIGYKEFVRIIETIEMMRDQIKYCVDTTDRLMSINRRRTKSKDQDSDVNKVVREALNSVKSPIESSRASIQTKFTSRLPKAAISSFELNQVLTKILTNAIQAITVEGSIHIRTSYLKTKKKICIFIKDDGAGIAKDDLSRVFDPFFSTKYRGLEKSSGLGLSIVQSILKASKGDIEIKSSLQKGTEVKILLPVV